MNRDLIIIETNWLYWLREAQSIQQGGGATAKRRDQGEPRENKEGLMLSKESLLELELEIESRRIPILKEPPIRVRIT